LSLAVRGRLPLRRRRRLRRRSGRVQLDHRQLRAQLRLRLRRIEVCSGGQALGSRARKLAALPLRHVRQLVHQEVIALLGARRVLPTPEVDLLAQRHRPRLVRRREQLGGLVVVQARAPRRDRKSVV
jgi:hypothetical protein